MNTKQKQSDSISNEINKIKLTPEARELLINYHNAVINIPSTEQIIKAFNVKITKQSISMEAKQRRGDK